MKKKQQTLGFTLIEVLATVSLLALVIGGGFYFADIGGKRDAVEQVALAQWVYSRMAQATLQVYVANGSRFNTSANDAATKTSLRDTRNIQDTAPNGKTWTAKSPTKTNEMTIVIPMNSATAASSFVSSYGTQGNIEVSISGTDSDQLEVKYIY